MSKWKVIQSLDECKPGSIYQEKLVVITTDTTSLEELKNKTGQQGGELTTVSDRVREHVERLKLLAYAVWVPKLDPITQVSDIEEGNLRIKIHDNE